MFIYNKILFDYAPWGAIEGYQEVLNGYETRLLMMDGTALPIAGAEYGYTITAGDVTPPFAEPTPPTPVPVPPIVPDIVSDLQFRLALNQTGLRSAVEAFVAQASQDVKDYWERSLTIHRYHPLISEGLPAIGKTDADADALFVLAATINDQ